MASTFCYIALLVVLNLIVGTLVGRSLEVYHPEIGFTPSERDR